MRGTHKAQSGFSVSRGGDCTHAKAKTAFRLPLLGPTNQRPKIHGMFKIHCASTCKAAQAKRIDVTTELACPCKVQEHKLYPFGMN